MYDDVALGLMSEVKRLFDPRDLLNPGVLVEPAPFDADIRLAAVPDREAARPRAFLRLAADGGDLTSAVHRCTGVGRCVADNTGTGGVMCPSFQATRDEKDSTRGRARVLQDVVTGRLDVDSAAVADSLDLCLACKGCARDCPTGVDMASYKAEWLHQKYSGKRRPRTHYSLGRLPALIAKVPPRLANAGLKAPALAAAFAGVDGRRSLPRLAPRPVSARRRASVESPDVVLWVDTFTNRFIPQVADAAEAVLAATGARVRVVAFGDECCGLTWISTGQLPQARARLGRLLTRLATEVPDGIPVVALEPSCLGVLREDSENLLPGGAPPIAARLRTLAEHLSAVGWDPPSLSGVEIVAQPHCHHASVLGGVPTSSCSAGPVPRSPGRGLLRAGRELRDGAGALRGVGRGVRARPRPGGPGGGGGRRGAGRRVLVPDAARRPGGHPQPAPGRAAGLPPRVSGHGSF